MTSSPLVGVIMGSSSDWDTLRHTAETLAALGVPHEVKVVSAHRTPDLYAPNSVECQEAKALVQRVGEAIDVGA